MEKRFPSQTLEKINIRLPRGLRGKLKKAAAQEGRTMNSQAVKLLKDGLDRLKQEAA